MTTPGELLFDKCISVKNSWTQLYKFLDYNFNIVWKWGCMCRAPLSFSVLSKTLNAVV